jgi:hypothetical protein
MEPTLWIPVAAFVVGLLIGAAAHRVMKSRHPHTAGGGPSAVAEPAKPQPKQDAKKPAAAPRPRSEALTLLATLQREARFVDFIKESLEGYSDAQIGAVARDVHRDCGKV